MDEIVFFWLMRRAFLTPTPNVVYRTLTLTGWWYRRFSMDFLRYETSSERVSKLFLLFSSSWVSILYQYGSSMSSSVDALGKLAGLGFLLFSRTREMLLNFWKLCLSWWSINYDCVPSWGRIHFGLSPSEDKAVTWWSPVCGRRYYYCHEI